MSAPRAGDNRPLHPDAYTHGVQQELEREFYEPPVPLSDSEVDVLWEQEQGFRASAAATTVAKPHKHACGHDCISGVCTLFALLNDWSCEACRIQLESSGTYWSR